MCRIRSCLCVSIRSRVGVPVRGVPVCLISLNASVPIRSRIFVYLIRSGLRVPIRSRVFVCLYKRVSLRA